MDILIRIFKGLILLLLLPGLIAWVMFIPLPKLSINSKASITEKVSSIDAWFTVLQSQNKFNGGVLILHDGTPLLSRGYGFTSAEKDQLLNEQSSFRLASLSKQFTAALIMRLHTQQRLDIDMPLSTYLPEFPYPDATIRHCLNQSSGIPDNYLSLAEERELEVGVLDLEKAVSLIIEAGAAGSQKLPNTRFSYSNTNYILLARIAEVVTGQSFEEAMDQEIFQPLGMQQARVWNLVSRRPPASEQASTFNNLKRPPLPMVPTFVDGVAGDGGVFVSLDDFILWDDFWYDNQLIDPELMRAAVTQPTFSTGKIGPYGFGWIIEDDEIWHNGSWLGANTYYLRIPEERKSLVVLDNSNNPFFHRIIKKLLPVFREL